MPSAASAGSRPPSTPSAPAPPSGLASACRPGPRLIGGSCQRRSTATTWRCPRRRQDQVPAALSRRERARPQRGPAHPGRHRRLRPEPGPGRAMRRIARHIRLCSPLAAGGVVAVAGADDKPHLPGELFNAFGLVKGSELRVAGVKAGTVTDLDITPQKTALVTFEVGLEFPEFKADASCSSEPQSLIAEYFLDCQPGSADAAPRAGRSRPPATRPPSSPTSSRTPCASRSSDRLQLLINEFGTALVGNAENLNAAIRSGAPALQRAAAGAEDPRPPEHDDRRAQHELGRDLRPARQPARGRRPLHRQRRGRTAAISAERRDDLAQNFDLLDDFLFELKPTMFQLGQPRRRADPAADRPRTRPPRASTSSAKNLPPFNNGAQRLARPRSAAPPHVGKVALANAKDEIAALNQASTKAFPAADVDRQVPGEPSTTRRNAVEEDCLRPLRPARAAGRGRPAGQAARPEARHDPARRPDVTCKWANGPRPGTNPSGGNPGYTGLEGLLNYAYVQTNSLNLFDELGHALGITLVAAPGAQRRVRLPDRARSRILRRQRRAPTHQRPEGLRRVRRHPRRPPARHQLRDANPAGLFGNLPPLRRLRLPRRQHASRDLRPGDPHARQRLAGAELRLHRSSAQQPRRPSRRQPQQQKPQKQLEKLLDAGKQPGQGRQRHGQEQLQDLLTCRSFRSCRSLPQPPSSGPDPAARPPTTSSTSSSGQ